MIIGLVGLIGSGKGTISDYLINEYGFVSYSFASSLKDCLSAIFGWDREMIEGSTIESREWREKIDPWWASKLSIPNFTPRWAMQNIGTELFRNQFHTDTWILSLQRKVLNSSSKNIVISDIRFKNEFHAVQDLGSTMIQVKRGNDPEWFKDACTVNTSTCNESGWLPASQRLTQYNIHVSEWSIAGLQTDFTIHNDDSVDQLKAEVSKIIKGLQ